MDLQGEGESTKEIGRRFDVRPRTVQTWLKAETSQKSRAGTAGQGGRETCIHPPGPVKGYP
jgi:transposase